MHICNHLSSKRRLNSLEEPYRLDGVIVALGASIGIAVFPDDAAFGEELVQQADRDM